MTRKTTISGTGNREPGTESFSDSKIWALLAKPRLAISKFNFPVPGSRSPVPVFLICRSGLAAVEFAFIAPLMILLFFGVLEGSAAYSMNRKIMLSANTLADLVAQETAITRDSLDDLFIGMEDVIDTRDIDVTFQVVSIVLDAATDEVKVHWSRDSAGGTPYAAGSVYAGEIDPTLLDDASSLIVAESTYDYASPISAKVIGPMTMNAAATRWPRMSAKVQYCVVAGSCTS